jgi:hypothetical protein
MIDKPEPGEARKPKLLIVDSSPLSVLSHLDDALDWLFKPGCEVWITDMVLIEARRPSPAGAGPRKGAKTNFEAWFRSNKHRIKIVTTDTGRDYSRSQRLWELAGRPDDLKPETSNLGEASILAKLKAIRAAIGEGETVIVIMDDRDGRAAVKALPMDVDLMGVQTFIAWIAEGFGVKEAATAWLTLVAILGDELDHGEETDPVFVRNR